MTDIVRDLLQIQNQLRLFHWQTKSYSVHKALGKAYEALDGLIDNFVETAMGKGDTDFNGEIIIKIFDINSLDLNEALETYKAFLLDLGASLNEIVDTDLINIRDEMLGEINKLSYLLTLK